MKHRFEIDEDRTPIVTSIIAVVIILIFCWPLRLQAKSFCGEVECYGCCVDNCDSLSLNLDDVGKKNLSLAVKSCKRGCSIIHWNASGMSGQISSKAEKVLGENCKGKDITYPEYCNSAISLWGVNCVKKINKKERDRDNTNKSDDTDIDERFNKLERATREKMARDMIRKAFSETMSAAIEIAMSKSDIMRGVNFGTITAPWRMAQEIQQIINRIKSVENIIPVEKLDTLDEITYELGLELKDAVSATKPIRPPTEPIRSSAKQFSKDSFDKNPKVACEKSKKAAEKDAQSFCNQGGGALSAHSAGKCVTEDVSSAFAGTPMFKATYSIGVTCNGKKTIANPSPRRGVKQVAEKARAEKPVTERAAKELARAKNVATPNKSDYICLPSQPLEKCSSYYQCTPANNSITKMYYHTSNGGDFYGDFNDPGSMEIAAQNAMKSCGM